MWTWSSFLTCLCLLLMANNAQSTMINFDEGIEYVYQFNSTMHILGVQQIFTDAEIGFVNVFDALEHMETLLVVHHVTFTLGSQPDMNRHDHDFTKWFSFWLSRRGEIGKVFYPPEEKEEVVMLKKGFAGLLSAKLHHQHEVDHTKHADGWSYDTEELGREGHHNSSYYVRQSSTKVEYRKTRTSSHTGPISGNSTNTKRMTITKELNTVHSVMLEETFTTDFSSRKEYET